jgi:tetratricopeptide (TPR) repeat protein
MHWQERADFYWQLAVSLPSINGLLPGALIPRSRRHFGNVLRHTGRKLASLRNLLKTIALGILSLSFIVPLSGAWASPPEETQIRFHLIQGVDKSLNLAEKEAEAEFHRAIELDPARPLGYAFEAMARLFFYETSFAEELKKKREASLLEAIEECQKRGERRIADNPNNGEAYFALALARMTRNRWEIVQQNYFRAFQEAQVVWDYLGQARERDPQNYDIYYPMGVLHYYLDRLPGLARWIMALFVTSGDREKGIQELQLAAQKGFFLKDLALTNLLVIYEDFEKKPGQALPLAQQLSKKYPDNYNFLFALANAFSDLARTEEAFGVAQSIRAEIESNRPPFRPELWPRYEQLMGRIYLAQGKEDKAITHFNRAISDHSPYNIRVRAWALVRLGMIQDARGERQKAEEYYRKALKLKGQGSRAQEAAREYLENPYKPPPPPKVR